jgi:hypothetical protein
MTWDILPLFPYAKEIAAIQTFIDVDRTMLRNPRQMQQDLTTAMTALRSGVGLRRP